MLARQGIGSGLYFRRFIHLSGETTHKSDARNAAEKLSFDS
jgi:hypothetical protein